MKSSGRVTKKISAFGIFNAVLMILLVAAFILPFWIILSASLSDNSTLMRDGVSLWIHGFTFEGYKFLFEMSDVFLHSIWVSIETAAIATLISVITCTFAAFALSNKQLVGRKFFNLFFMIPMFFNGGTIPTYLVVRGVGLFDSIWALILPGCVGAYNILLLRNYFYGLSPALGEAAELDGANDFQMVCKIYIPLALPMMFTVGMTTFVAKWNSWLPSLLYLDAKNSDLWTVQYVLRQMMTNMQSLYGSSATGSISNAPLISAKNAGIVFVVLPLVVLSPLLQKFFVGGITAGAVKG